MPMAGDIVGSWFPSGFYGHFRNKARADFINEYRQLAKPQPPDKFVKRALQPTSKYPFSHHDNRNSFMSDAQYFEQGLGKKRNAEKSSRFDPDFYTWVPIKEEMRLGRPLKSTYQRDFSKNGRKEMLVRRPHTSFEGDPTTSYRYAHCDVGPNTQEIAQVSRKAVELTTFTRLQRAKTARPVCRDTVASCLSWYRPKVPQATTVTNYCNPACNYPCNNNNNNNNSSQPVHVPTPPATAPPAMQQHVEVLPPPPPPAPVPMAAE